MTLTDHLRQPWIPVNHHIAHRAAELSAAVQEKVAIYLDTRFWIMVREVAQDSSTSTEERKIVRLLDAIVGGGIGLCPIAEPTFSELMNQGEAAGRRTTAEAIERLSLGVSFLPDLDRMIGDARAHLTSVLALEQSAEFPAWTRLAYVLGRNYPQGPSFQDDQDQAGRQAFHEYLWDIPLAEIAMAIDGQVWSPERAPAMDARRVSEANARKADEVRSFDEAREAEFHRVAEMIARCGEHLLPLATDISAMGSKPVPILTNALREVLKNPKQARRMPAAHVEASLHALFRWEHRDRDLTSNDLADFRHASAALGRCQLMLTEAHLREAICHPRIGLDAFHGCRVVSDLGEAVDQLEVLLASR